MKGSEAYRAADKFRTFKFVTPFNMMVSNGTLQRHLNNLDPGMVMVCLPLFTHIVSIKNQPFMYQ